MKTRFGGLFVAAAHGSNPSGHRLRDVDHRSRRFFVVRRPAAATPFRMPTGYNRELDARDGRSGLAPLPKAQRP